MAWGPLTYLWLVAKTAWRHSFHAAHSVILALIVVVGLLTYFVPRLEVMVDLHGWQVATFVLSSIVFVRLILAPYWIWKDDGEAILKLNSLLQPQVNETIKQAAIDDLAEEINWATDNLVNPRPHPLRPDADILRETDLWSRACDSWYGRISNKLANRDVFTRSQQLHFDVLTRVDQVVSIGNMNFGKALNILHTKIRRLREIIEQVGRG